MSEHRGEGEPRAPTTSAREFLNLEKVYAACLARGLDPHEIIAEAFEPVHIKEMGRAVVTKFAMDLVLKAEGQTVNINGSFTPPIDHDPVSETVGWAADIVGKGKDGEGSGSSSG